MCLWQSTLQLDRYLIRIVVTLQETAELMIPCSEVKKTVSRYEYFSDIVTHTHRYNVTCMHEPKAAQQLWMT